MAEFGIRATNLGGPSFAGSSPVAPVQRAGNAPVLPTALIDTGIAVAESVQKQRGADAALSANGVFGLYQKQLAGVAQAKDFGDISDAEANARVRAISAKFLAEGGGGDPKFAETLKKVKDSVFGVTSLAEAEETEKISNELRKSQLQEARKMGLISNFSNLTPELEDQASEVVARIMRAESDFARYTARNSEQRSQNAENRAQQSHDISMDEYVRKEAVKLSAQSALTEAADWSNKVLTNLDKQIAGGQISFIQAQGQANTLFAQYRATMVSQTADDPASAANIATMIDSLQKSWLDANNPETKNAQTTALYQEQMKRWQLMAMAQSENVRKAAVSSALMPNVPLSTTQAVQGVADLIDKVTLPDVPIQILGANNPDVENGFYTTISRGIQSVKSGTATNPQGIMNEATQGVNKTLENMAAVGPTANRNPVILKDATKFIASPEMAELVKQNALDPVTRSQARATWQSTYEESVKRGATRLLNSPVGLATSNAAGPSQPTPTLASLIDFNFTGNGLQIIDKRGSNPVASPQYLRQQEGNIRKFTEAFNLLIKAGAHLEGTTDYRGYWDRNKHVLLPDFFMSPEQEAIKRKEGYLGGNYRNPANWRLDNGGNQ